jgi:predicted TIM-barrel fold metal-dependent hydrolase
MDTHAPAPAPASPCVRRPIVDAHHHFWDLRRNHHPWLCDAKPIAFRYGDYTALRRNYLQADYLTDTADFEVQGTVYVETEWDPADPRGEMAYVSELRAATGLPTVAVAHTRLDSPEAADLLNWQAGFSFVRSIRHKPRAHPTPGGMGPGGMADAAWRAGFSRLAPLGLRFDLQTPWWHMQEAVDLAHTFADTQIIINHAGLPADRSAEGLRAWRSAMAAVAQCPNVSVKISGIGVPGRLWTPQANREIVLGLIDLFGVPRCMFASNFPVDGLCGRFDEIYRGFETLVADFSTDEQDALFRRNAIVTYDMERAHDQACSGTGGHATPDPPRGSAHPHREIR